MPHHIREHVEARERETLSPFAAKAAESLGRPRAEEPDPVRTAFQRDRDRILHSKPFRRLKHKTQVFIDPTGDHYRTRMTHTLEVAQIARTVGRALRLNEDLIEAIALGHDIGHTPFGHAGEQALDDALREHARANGVEVPDFSQPEAPKAGVPPLTPREGPDPVRFRHYEQSLRIVDALTPMNLSQEVRMGIGGHSKGRNDLSAHDGQPTSTLEAAVVRISDRIAYLNHDLDDALRSGLIDAPPSWISPLGATHGERVGTMVLDLIVHSEERPEIAVSSAMLGTLNDLKEWLFENVYLLYPARYPDVAKARNVVRELFGHFLQPDTLPDGFVGVQGAVDYLAGMTDRFAIETYAELRVPRVWRSLPPAP